MSTKWLGVWNDNEVIADQLSSLPGAPFGFGFVIVIPHKYLNQ